MRPSDRWREFGCHGFGVSNPPLRLGDRPWRSWKMSLGALACAETAQGGMKAREGVCAQGSTCY